MPLVVTGLEQKKIRAYRRENYDKRNKKPPARRTGIFLLEFRGVVEDGRFH